MDDARQIQHGAFLERMRETDRVFARRRLQTAPHELSDYEKQILGDEYRTHVRRLAATQEAAREATRRRETVTAALRPRGIVFRTPFLKQLNDHAVRLASESHVTVVCAGVGGRAHASQDNRSITVPPVTDEGSYAIFLHELGHTSPEGDSRQYRHVVTSSSLIAIGGETGAWKWAVSHALYWTRNMQDVLSQSLDSYRSHATTSDERDAITDCIAWALAKVTGPGALAPWRQQAYDAGARVVHKGVAWQARVYLHGSTAWPAPGDERVCWEKCHE